jgi:cytochrome b involved in lipid metabolism
VSYIVSSCSRACYCNAPLLHLFIPFIFILLTMSQRFSAADVASHNKGDNLWLIVDEDVYDVTKFQDDHPGGKKSES